MGELGRELVYVRGRLEEPVTWSGSYTGAMGFSLEEGPREPMPLLRDSG